MSAVANLIRAWRTRAERAELALTDSRREVSRLKREIMELRKEVSDLETEVFRLLLTCPDNTD